MEEAIELLEMCVGNQRGGGLYMLWFVWLHEFHHCMNVPLFVHRAYEMKHVRWYCGNIATPYSLLNQC